MKRKFFAIIIGMLSFVALNNVLDVFFVRFIMFDIKLYNPSFIRHVSKFWYSLLVMLPFFLSDAVSSFLGGVVIGLISIEKKCLSMALLLVVLCSLPLSLTYIDLELGILIIAIKNIIAFMFCIFGMRMALKLRKHGHGPPLTQINKATSFAVQLSTHCAQLSRGHKPRHKLRTRRAHAITEDEDPTNHDEQHPQGHR